MINALEAAVQQNLTIAFIDADSVQVTLVPADYVSNGSGGRKRVDLPPRLPQKMRLIPQGSTVSTERETLDGVSVMPTMVLLAAFNAGMARGDRFVDNGIRYEVVFVHEKRDYETKGEVITRGAE